MILKLMMNIWSMFWILHGCAEVAECFKSYGNIYIVVNVHGLTVSVCISMKLYKKANVKVPNSMTSQNKGN